MIVGSEFETGHLSLREHESTDPIQLSPEALQTIRSTINKDKTRLGLEFDEEGRSVISANRYVGMVGLPNGPTIDIQPKESVADLLLLLQYAEGVSAVTLAEKSAVSAGTHFLDTLSIIFESELRSVLSHGLSREYEQTDGSEQFLQGRLRVSDQLRHQQIAPTKFECRYRDFTFNTIINQSVLKATEILIYLTNNESTARELRAHRDRLTQIVSPGTVSLAELKRVELNRLNEYYETLVQLTEFILESSFIGDIEQGSKTSYSLLVNMNTVFEKIVERAASHSINSFDRYSVRTQFTDIDLLLSGEHDIKLQPDLVVLDSNESVQLVGDAKWKTGGPSNADLYQILAYQQAFDAPALLFYPTQIDSNHEFVAKSRNGKQIGVAELPVNDREESLAGFQQSIEARMEDELSKFLA